MKTVARQEKYKAETTRQDPVASRPPREGRSGHGQRRRSTTGPPGAALRMIDGVVEGGGGAGPSGYVVVG